MAPKRRPSLSSSGGSGGGGDGILSRISENSIVRKGTSAACAAACVGKRLVKSTGEKAWFVATSFIVVVLPLMIVMDREAQLNEADLQQASLLGAAPAYSPFN